MTKVVRKTETKKSETPLIEGTMVENRAGGAAFKLDDYTALVSYLTTGGFGGTYYATESTINTEARTLFLRFALIDPEFLAKAIVYARQNGNMRSMPILGYVCLSTGGPTAKRFFHAITKQVILTPGDAADALKLTRGADRVRGSGRAVRTALGDWLTHISSYHVVKGTGDSDWKLRDLARLLRPNDHGLTPEQDATMAYIVKGTITEATPYQIRGYEEFKKAEADIDTLLAMVAEYRLPWEVVSGQLSGGDVIERRKVWAAMGDQMPYMALLRNLNNLLRSGVLEDSTVRAKFLSKLTNPEAVKRSRQLPFRFWSAHRAVDSLDGVSHTVRSEVLAAISKALDLSVGNLELGGRVLSVLDVSGSMGGCMVSQGKSSISCIDIGAIFAASVYKVGAESDMMTFDYSARYVKGLNRDASVLNIAKQINASGGGTALHSAIQLALESGKEYDTLVFITDNESWYNELGGGVMRQFGMNASSQLARNYVAKFPNSKLFFIDLAPNQTHPIMPDLPNCYFIAGWSSSVLDFIQSRRVDVAGQVATIQAMTLEGTVVTEKEEE